MRLSSRLAALLLIAALALCGCNSRDAEGTTVLLDGAAWDGSPVDVGVEGPRVYVTLDGAALIDLAFNRAHTLTIKQRGIGENTVEITGEAVYMAGADCENQDCVQMGQVTLDNLEVRVMGGFIVCLPHKLAVEVRGE